MKLTANKLTNAYLTKLQKFFEATAWNAYWCIFGFIWSMGLQCRSVSQNNTISIYWKIFDHRDVVCHKSQNQIWFDLIWFDWLLKDPKMTTNGVQIVYSFQKMSTIIRNDHIYSRNNRKYPHWSLFMSNRLANAHWTLMDRSGKSLYY